MHKDRGFPMIPTPLVNTQVKKLLFNYKRKYGTRDLVPKRKQPFTREIFTQDILGTPENHRLGNWVVKKNSRRWRSIAGLTRTLSQTGFRKAEISVDKHGQPCDADCLSRKNLQWFLAGKIYESGNVPSHLLRAAGPGDYAILTPPPSKSDPFDMVWGDKPIFIPFSTDGLAAFGGLAEIELHDELVGTAEATALFSDDDGLPFSGAQLDQLLKQMLSRRLPAGTVKLYSWHSARIWLACALLAAKASRAEIQAICRWQTDESLNIYACMGVKHYTSLITSALAQSIDAGRASTLAEALPFIDISDLTHAQGDAPQHIDLEQEPDPDDDADD
jgi:hypothetical protein